MEELVDDAVKNCKTYLFCSCVRLRKKRRVFIFFVTKTLFRCLLDDPAPSVSGAGEFCFTVTPMMYDVYISRIAVDFRE